MKQLNIFNALRKAAVLVSALALMGACCGCVHRVEYRDSVDDFGYVYAAVREYRSTHDNPDYGEFAHWMKERGRE